MTERPSDYLWDRSGEPDPDVVRLEAVLGTLGHRAAMPPLPARPGAPRPTRAPTRIAYAALGLTAAAVLCLVAGAAWSSIVQRGSGWGVEALAGQPVLDGKALDTSGRLSRGTWLETGDGSKARVTVGLIGLVDVDPNTRLQLVRAGGRQHRMALQQGTIHAQIWAAPIPSKWTRGGAASSG